MASEAVAIEPASAVVRHFRSIRPLQRFVGFDQARSFALDLVFQIDQRVERAAGGPGSALLADQPFLELFDFIDPRGGLRGLGARVKARRTSCCSVPRACWAWGAHCCWATNWPVNCSRASMVELAVATCGALCEQPLVDRIDAVQRGQGPLDVGGLAGQAFVQITDVGQGAGGDVALLTLFDQQPEQIVRGFDVSGLAGDRPQAFCPDRRGGFGPDRAGR